MAQDRIDGIEEQIAHLTRAVEDLSDLVRAQGEQIDRLTQRLRLLSERERDGGAQGPLADQRPPHW